MQPLIDSDTQWRDLPDYAGIYSVSEEGKIFSHPRTEFVQSKRTGGHYRYRSGSFIKTQVNKLGYEQVGLYLEGVCSRVLVHRLVAKAFVENPLELPEVNHKDGNKSNNCVSNLEWVSRRQNALHGTRILGKNRGENNLKSKLLEVDVLNIRLDLEKGLTQTEVAKRYNITNHAIFRIQHGYNWAWLTGYEKKGRPECLCKH